MCYVCVCALDVCEYVCISVCVRARVFVSRSNHRWDIYHLRFRVGGACCDTLVVLRQIECGVFSDIFMCVKEMNIFTLYENQGEHIELTPFTRCRLALHAFYNRWIAEYHVRVFLTQRLGGEGGGGRGEGACSFVTCRSH